MQRRSPILLLGARACTLGGVAAASGVIGHVHAGGVVPTLNQLLVVWLASSALSAGFLLREAGWLRIAMLLLGEQLLIHTSLMWIVGMPRMSMPGMASMPGMRDMSVLPSLDMLAAHAAAAAIAGLWLWRGERALWTLVALAGTVLDRWWRPMMISPPPSASLADAHDSTGLLSPWGPRLAREVPRRGPPRIAVL